MDAPQWKVTEIWQYPIKSCAGTRLEEARIGVHGLQDDRRYMVVDAETGMFVAQRGDGGLGIAIRTMCQIVPKNWGAGNIELSAPGMKNIRFCSGMWDSRPSNQREVQVWKFRGQAVRGDRQVNDWFTEFLSRERPGYYELVTISDEFVRRAKIGYSQLRFADAYPFLVISQESLDDLNQRIGGEPLPMNRFRPNIVIAGGRPYDEDRLNRMAINGVDFEGMELCVRCPITTTDQQTAVAGKEPLRTLATYRRNPIPGKGGVVFGRNFNHLSTGVIHIGDRVDFQDYRESGPCDPQ